MPHESRLLLLTIVVCVTVLLVLARLRFPEPPAIAERAVQPLDRLAAQASYAALAADIERVQAAIAPNVIVLRTTPRVAPRPRRARDLLDPPGGSSGVRHVPALRIGSDSALAAVAPSMRIDGIVSAASVAGTAAVLGVDAVRGIGRVRVPEAVARPLATVALGALRTPVYIVAVEGTPAGMTLRPVFLGRGERFSSPRWTRPLVPLAGIALSPGALLFTLAGEFIGCVIVEDGAPAIAGARDLLDAIDGLVSTAGRVPATLGIAVQPLTRDLAAALSADRGVVIADVDPHGPAAGTLRPGDVVTALEREPVGDPDRFLLRVASRPVGQPVALTVLRNRATITRTLMPVPAEASESPEPETIAFGRNREGLTWVLSANRGQGFIANGLRAGDIVVGAGELSNPTPTQLRRLIATARPDTPIAFTIRREGEQRVVAAQLQANASTR